MHIYQLFGKDKTVKTIEQGQMYYIVNRDQGYVLT